MPPTSRLLPHVFRLLLGYLHSYLAKFSAHYCNALGVPFDRQIVQLPFGSVLKWSDGTRLEEVQAMMVARAAGFPVPKVISYDEHPDCPHTPVSILMTRLPGEELAWVEEYLTDTERHAIQDEMRFMLSIMRNWRRARKTQSVSSVTGTDIRSVHIPGTPGHRTGPWESEVAFNEYLLSFASSWSMTEKQAQKDLALAKTLHSVAHPIVFSRGDLKPQNIMVHEGRVSGFIDWKSAGWYPDYWDYTTALKFQQKGFWWYDFVMATGGSRYQVEYELQTTVVRLTCDSLPY
ncbi:kinase-like domain-containing protein [Lophiotrema nucula]|uniref:Kinase-like domain-containing protein n=1 Tax=Lophiotrema nucula TaxID=690887 RepID=A0A6A5Z5N4_9PLEO|nr:kinase-like domain-containing protein [Lophiotrema nucula]